MTNHSDLLSFARHLSGQIHAWSQSPGPQKNAAFPFETLALQLFTLQFEHNAVYRRFCQARSASPESVDHWREIPALPASAFKEREVSGIPPQHRTLVFCSSGTSQAATSKHYHGAESLELYEASLWQWFDSQIMNRSARHPQPRLICLTPSPDQAPRSSLVYMFDVIRRRLAQSNVFTGEPADDGAWSLNMAKTLRALEEVSNSGQPSLVLGTAFSFVHLLDELHDLNRSLKLAPGTRIMETGGYKGRSRAMPKSELHESLCTRLGILPNQIVCEYGMSELSSQAYDASALGVETSFDALSSLRASLAPRLFYFPPWARVQIISPETGNETNPGEPGLIRVYDLANACSAMVVQTEDLGVQHGGSGFELLGRAALAEPRGCSLMLETA